MVANLTCLPSHIEPNSLRELSGRCKMPEVLKLSIGYEVEFRFWSARRKADLRQLANAGLGNPTSYLLPMQNLVSAISSCQFE